MIVPFDTTPTYELIEGIVNHKVSKMTKKELKGYVHTDLILRYEQGCTHEEIRDEWIELNNKGSKPYTQAELDDL